MKHKLAIIFLTLLGSLSQNLLAEKIILQNKDWLLSQEKRALLSFITECALQKDQILIAETNEITFEFYGKLGAGPSWNGLPSSLTETEQRWVSACVLARVNYFGTPVTFNLRTDKGSGLYLPVTASDIDEFPYYEGGFFGNIFHEPQKKYVCLGDAPTKILVGKGRICALPSLDGDMYTSACGFNIVGGCDDPFILNRDNTIYKEVFHVWLKIH
jgi:hypothetical protein